jgi:predicted  nucleic acid-binding Zn-ribbon protein
MENNIDITSLSSKVADARVQARNILRMKKINKALQDKYILSQCADYIKDNIKDIEKTLARHNYAINKLDKENPDYDDLLKDLNESKEYAEKCLADNKDALIKKEKDITDETAKLDQKIADWESGEKKVSIDEVYALADKIVSKI